MSFSVDCHACQRSRFDHGWERPCEAHTTYHRGYQQARFERIYTTTGTDRMTIWDRVADYLFSGDGLQWRTEAGPDGTWEVANDVRLGTLYRRPVHATINYELAQCHECFAWVPYGRQAAHFCVKENVPA